jgi:type IV secretory pathway VirB2 component (pilin)
MRNGVMAMLAMNSWRRWLNFVYAMGLILMQQLKAVSNGEDT